MISVFTLDASAKFEVKTNDGRKIPGEFLYKAIDERNNLILKGWNTREWDAIVISQQAARRSGVTTQTMLNLIEQIQRAGNSVKASLDCYTFEGSREISECSFEQEF